MVKFGFLFALLVVLLFTVDWYVYKHWKLFVRTNKRLKWTRPVYFFMMCIMPGALPAYLYFSRWWEVEPKLGRALFFGWLAVYYVPKFIIAVVLAVKDLGRMVFWLFRWFQVKLDVPRPRAIPDDSAPERQLDLTDMKRLSRRDFLEKMGWSASTVPFVVTGYSVFKTLYDFNIQRVDVPLPNLPAALDGLQIVQLSDIHAGSFFSERPMQEAVEITRGIKPDILVITGDYVNNNDRELERIMPALKGLQAPLGVFGCLGNHDHYANTAALTERLKSSPIDLLVNEHRSLQIDGHTLHLIGTDNTGFNQQYADLPKALQGIENPSDTHILLAHDPTFWDKYILPETNRKGVEQIDLMLCGHTHGGQIGIELGPLRWSLARLAYPRWAGLYSETNAGTEQFLYVNRGLGTVGPPIRFGMRPEITVLTLRKATAISS